MGRPLRAVSYCFIAVVLSVFYFVSFDLHSNATIFIDDGLEYSKRVEWGVISINPHHLLYHPLVFLTHKIASVIQPGLFPRAVISLHLFSSVMGAIGILFFFAAMRRLVGTATIAGVAAALLAFCRGYWYYAASAETIVPGVAMSIICFYLLLVTIERPSRCAFACLGLVNALAILMRQDNFLLLVPFSCLIVASMPDEKGRRLLYYWVPLFTAVAAVYACVYIARIDNHPSLSKFYSWLTLYNQHPGWGSWGNVETSAVRIGLVRFAQAVGLGGLKGVPLISYGEIPAIAEGVSQVVSIMLACGLVLLLAFCIFSRNSATPNEKKFVSICILWIVVRELFYLWWLPERALSWSVGSMVPFWAIVGIILARVRSGCSVFVRRSATSVFLLAVFLSGLLTMQCGSRPEYYARLSFYDSFSRPGDLIFVRDFHDDVLLSYFGSRNVQIIDYYGNLQERSLLPERDKKAIDAALNNGHRVYVIPFAQGDMADSCFNPRYSVMEKDVFSAYRLTPCHILSEKKRMPAAWRLSYQ